MNPSVAFVLGLGIFMVSALLAKQLPNGSPVWASQVVTKLTMALLSLAAIRYFSPMDWAAAGFKRPINTRWRQVIPLGLAMGAVTTLIIRLSHSHGLASMLKDFSFPAIVLTIWLGSSISEEIFARGWFQSAVASRTKHAALLSALLFATLHLGLILKGIDPFAVTVLFIATFLLGWAAGRFREQSGSLLPAIAVHIAFNVGGVIGGIASLLVEKLVFKGAV